MLNPLGDTWSGLALNAAGWALVVLGIKGFIVLFKKDFSDVLRDVVHEFLDALMLRPTLKSLNAFGMTLLFLFLLAAIFSGSASPPIPPGSTPFEVVLINHGAQAMYAFLLLGGLIGCVMLSRNERR